MADSEWKVSVHREGKFVGLKNHRLVYGGEGKNNQWGRFFDDEVIRKGQKRKWSKRLVGKQQKATSKVMAPDCQPILMGNSANGSVGKKDWRPSMMGHQGNRT